MIDTHQKGGVHALGVVRDHRVEAQGAGALGCDGGAEEAGRVVEEEHDIFGRDLLRGHDQVALVLSVLVIDDDLRFRPGRLPRWPRRFGRSPGPRARHSSRMSNSR